MCGKCVCLCCTAGDNIWRGSGEGTVNLMAHTRRCTRMLSLHCADAVFCVINHVRFCKLLFSLLCCSATTYLPHSNHRVVQMCVDTLKLHSNGRFHAKQSETKRVCACVSSHPSMFSYLFSKHITYAGTICEGVASMYGFKICWKSALIYRIRPSAIPELNVQRFGSVCKYTLLNVSSM